jgi:hypothetical protein
MNKDNQFLCISKLTQKPLSPREIKRELGSFLLR